MVDRVEDERSAPAGPPPRYLTVPPWATGVALGALVALLAATALWEYLTITYVLMLFCWLVIAGGLAGTRIVERLSRRDVLWQLEAVLLVAVIVRWAMLLQGEVMTRDVVVAIHRGQSYLDGAIPYMPGFEVNKPPAYLFLSSGLVATVGPSVLAFRAMMGLVDASVAVMLLCMARERTSPRAALAVALLYAINPLSAVSVGIGGHYDPVVVLCALGGLWLLMRGSPVWGSLALGVGFALKLYPAVLLPWALVEERRWGRRVMMVVAFAAPMALTWAPILAQNPDALHFYATWQAAWAPKKGIAYGMAMIAGWGDTSAAAKAASTAVEYVFLGLLAMMFLDWLRRRSRAPDKHLRDWFLVLMACYYALYAFMFVGTAMDPRFDAGVDRRVLAVAVAAAYLPLGAMGMWWLWRGPQRVPLGVPAGDRQVMLAALSVAFLLFSSAQYNPWYLLWLLPLVLLIGAPRVREAWLSMLPWNAEGSGVRLWPGRTL
jgi:hypothetical protein